MIMGKGDYLGEFELIVMYALVQLGSNAYGMTIRADIEDRIERNVSVGAIYTTLDRLEKKGYVSSRVGEATPERGGRAKKYFKIEAPGELAFNRTRLAFARMSDGLVWEGG